MSNRDTFKAKGTPPEVNADAVRAAIKLIANFDKECEENEYTDTGDVWDIFARITTLLTEALGE